MKRFILLPILVIPLLVAGCASYSGGSAGNYDDNFDDGYGTTSLGPQRNDFQEPGSGTIASPTFRSGLHPQDIRDPSALMWPRPYRGMR